jgi:hypothetical protein
LITFKSWLPKPGSLFIELKEITEQVSGIKISQSKLNQKPLNGKIEKECNFIIEEELS